MFSLRDFPMHDTNRYEHYEDETASVVPLVRMKRWQYKGFVNLLVDEELCSAETLESVFNDEHYTEMFRDAAAGCGAVLHWPERPRSV